MTITTELINQSVVNFRNDNLYNEDSQNPNSLNVLYNDNAVDNVVPKRKRNHYWVEANSITRETFWVDNEGEDRYFYRRQGVKVIPELGNLYHQTVKARIIWLRGLGSQGKHYHMFLPYRNRFDIEYMKDQVIKIRKAFKGLELHNSIIFLTLTIDPKHYNSLYEGHKDIQRKVNHLLTILRKKYPHVFRYVKVAEIQTANTFNVHYHIAMSIRSTTGMDYNVMYFDQNEDIYHFVKGLWDYEKGQWHIGTAESELVEEITEGLAHYVRVTGYETVNHHTQKFVRKYKGTIQGYMLKYLYKAINPKEEDTLIGTNNAILWALNSRVFSHTNIEKWRKDNELPDLIRADKNNSNPELSESADTETITWEYQGLLFSEEIGYLEGIYNENELEPSILELLYHKYYRGEIKKNNDNG
jgi:hypothetical protein